MFHLLWRQRRRFAAVAAMSAVAGSSMGTGAPLAAAALAALGFALALSAAILLRPQRRLLVTRLAVWLLLAVIVGLALPGAILPLLTAAFALAAFVPVPADWQEMLRLPGIVQTRVRRKLAVPPQVLWDRLYPAATDNHWDPAISAITAGRLPHHYFVNYAEHDYRGAVRIPIQVFDVDPGRTFKVRDLSQPEVEDGGPVAITQTTVEPHADGSLLTVHEGTWRPVLADVVNRWLDDILGDQVEHIAAHLEDRRDHSVTGRGWVFRLEDGT